MPYRNKRDAIKRLHEKEKVNPNINFIIVYDPFDTEGEDNETPYYVLSESFYYTPECEGGPCFSGSEVIINLD